MKKVILAAAAALMSFSLSAQVFVGGSIGLTNSSSTDKLTTPPTTVKTTNFTLSPQGGIILSDKLCVGARLNLSFNSNTGANSKFFGFGINPYGRYSLIDFNRFHIVAEGGLSFDLGTNKTTYTNIGFDKDTDTSFSIYIAPVLTFDLTEKIALETNLNFARLSLAFASHKSVTHNDNPAADLTTRNDSDTDINFGLNCDDLIGRLGVITIGMVYKF